MVRGEMKRVVLALLVLAIAGVVAFWFLTSPDRQSAGLEAIPAGRPDLANGRTMFYAGGCASCHATPEQDDKTRLGGGFALTSAFGTFYAPNISPHPSDGIGNWTPEQFLRAMRGGVSPEGRHYYPSFPYTSYQRMTPTDLRDLLGFLKTLPVVDGRARSHDLPFVFTIRRGLGLWKLLFLDGQMFTPDSSRSASWNRGAYLIEGPGHCAECHSPRSIFGAIIKGQRFSGGPNPEGRGWVPNITPHEDGLKDWSRDEVAEILSTGLTPSGESVASSMAAVVRNASQLLEADRDAMAEYVLSLPPREGRKPATKDDANP
jgi:mono/diheme cytochrome c family protein